VPPTAIHTGSGSCSGRGYTAASCSAGRWRQVELLGEQLVVVVEVVAEQREGLDERAAAGHDLGAPAGDEVERGERLEDAHGVVRAQDADRAGEPDAPRAGRRRGEHHGGGRHREVGAVVLADAEDVEPHLVGERDLLDEVAHPLAGGDRPARPRVRRDLAERVDAQLHALEG
jgi:hypothetical protein